MKKLRIKDLLLKYPALDRARVHGFAAFFQHGLFVYDTTFRRLAVIPEAARPYVRTAGAWGFKPGALDSLKPAIYAYFHGHMHVLLGLVPRERMTLIVSNSRDGEAIARAAEGMGYQVARGSRTEGGVRGALKLMGAAGSDRSILFPVDGPRGPKHKVKPEIIRMAQLTGLPIIPVIARPRTMDVMGTWDNYNCIYMHALTLHIFGAPLFVPPSDNQSPAGNQSQTGETDGAQSPASNQSPACDQSPTSDQSPTGDQSPPGERGRSEQIEKLRYELEIYMLALEARSHLFFEKEVYEPYLD